MSQTAGVKCPGCGAEYALGKEYWDKNAVCPACETAFYVPPPVSENGRVMRDPPPRTFVTEDTVPAE